MTTTQNLHAELAQNWSGVEHEERQIEATLAVAYEQRTTNLIALWQNPAVTVKNLKGNTLTWSLTEKQLGPLLEQIIERLGLPQ